MGIEIYKKIKNLNPKFDPEEFKEPGISTRDDINVLTKRAKTSSSKLEVTNFFTRSRTHPQPVILLAILAVYHAS